MGVERIGKAKDTLLAMIPEEHVPSQLAVSRLVQALADRGDLQGVLEVQGVVTELGASLNLSRMLFINNIALAHIMSGNVDAAVEGLEAQFSDPDGPVVSSIGYLYRQLLQNNKQDAIDKLTVMAERLANESSIYRAAVDLFLEYVHLERKEDARLLLQRCAGIAEQKSVLGSYMVRMARSSQARSIETLQELIPDFTEKEIYYSYLVKCYKGDLPGMKAMRQQMQEEGVVADPLTLHVMAGVYKTAGEAVPFEEPTEASVEEEIQRRRGKPLLVAPATEA
ncbi:hypothetical protein COCON_G00225650 [Conger conger]|uniref:Uncharacterized protein n=1 Tax=Conger conger TaxID=82655 RepID=A0A9Q1CWY3_CONCO|nr:hypothetical protein COCON_G00225650 [Conger conger]